MQPPAGELASVLGLMDGYGALIEKAVMPLEGLTGRWHKAVGYEPLFKGGPVVQELRGAVASPLCKEGTLKEIPDGGPPGLEVNWRPGRRSSARPRGDPRSRAPAPPPAKVPALSPAEAADPNVAEHETVLAEGDRLFAEGDYFNAVRTYERAWRVAYRHKLANDQAALDARLVRAKAARDTAKR